MGGQEEIYNCFRKIIFAAFVKILLPYGGGGFLFPLNSTLKLKCNYEKTCECIIV
ncbi:MAG: hypothetical protein LBJ94_03465 [Puniceicoccales bacterium]|jgi:hypothetical protein|nr:hypothetical protein [Puniceicoccales bacterium]